MSHARASHHDQAEFSEQVVGTQQPKSNAEDTDVEDAFPFDAQTEASPSQDVQQDIYVPALSGSPNPSEDVERNFHIALTNPKMNPVVDKFTKDDDTKELFFDLFARQCNMIKSRCQAFEDCHITVFDKVLLKLTDNGNRFDNTAAQAFYCAEYLGINPDGNPELAQKILDQNVVFKAILARAVTPRDQYGQKYSAKTAYGVRGEEAAPITQSTAPKGKMASYDPTHPRFDPGSHSEDPSLSLQKSQSPEIGEIRESPLRSEENKRPVALQEGDLSFSRTFPPLIGASGAIGASRRPKPIGPANTTHPEEDDSIGKKMVHLVAMFRKARHAFEAVDPGEYQKKLEAARFLRDTVENTTHYIRDVPSGSIRELLPEEFMDELKRYGKASQASVVILSDGKKRRFDTHSFKVPRRTEDRFAERERDHDDGRGSHRHTEQEYDPGRPADYLMDRNRDKDFELATGRRGRSSQSHRSTTDTYIPTTDTYIPTTDTYIPGTTDTYIPGTTDTYIPGTTDTYIPGTTDTYIPGSTDTYIPGEDPDRTRAHGRGHNDAYSRGYADESAHEYDDDYSQGYGASSDRGRGRGRGRARGRGRGRSRGRGRGRGQRSSYADRQREREASPAYHHEHQGREQRGRQYRGREESIDDRHDY